MSGQQENREQAQYADHDQQFRKCEGLGAGSVRVIPTAVNTESKLMFHSQCKISAIRYHRLGDGAESIAVAVAPRMLTLALRSCHSSPSEFFH